jgi:hypothetical protein
MQEDQTNEQLAKHYRMLATKNRRMAAELLTQGKDNQLTRDAVADLLKDARDNEAIANDLESKTAI